MTKPAPANTAVVPGDLCEDYNRLADAIRSRGSMVVAYSGGVDSGLLAFVARRVLGENMMCVIGVSPSLARAEHGDALAFLERHGIPYEQVNTYEMDDPRYRANNGDRCFFCKDELFSRIDVQPFMRRFSCVAYGANTDDLGDHRPGARAALAHGVVAPLVDAGFDKALIRRMAAGLELELWDKPAAPCLASRLPYRTAVSPDRLGRVERAEAVLKARGFSECRVRYYGEEARVEVPLAEHPRLREDGTWRAIVDGIRASGFDRVTLAADGLRSGRLNAALERPEPD